MRKSGRCPKCNGSSLLAVAEIPDSVDPVTFTAQRVARLPNAPGFFVRERAAGILEAWICRACGFTELYTRDPDKIPIDGVAVRIVDGGSPSSGPHR